MNQFCILSWMRLRIYNNSAESMKMFFGVFKDSFPAQHAVDSSVCLHVSIVHFILLLSNILLCDSTTICPFTY